MSNAGQAALSIVGGVIGFVASGFNPAGAAWGYCISAMPGAATFALDDALELAPRAETTPADAPDAVP